VAPRKGSQRVAVLNAGTIPDRGLYGVFLSGDDGPASRVGELDEEMVFETHPGDVFLLGASSWRVLEITHDRVLVAPAPGEPGKMPFWRGDGPGRPLEFGRAIGQLSRELVELDRQQAHETLVREHGLDRRAAKNLLDYLHQQREATVEVPSDRTIVIECFFDEVGDWRIVILSPFGARVHAPWATAVAARLRAETAGEVDMMWTDDGMVFRLPESDEPPPVELLVPAAEEVEDLVVGQLGSTALFAARFRENAARALLLPRRHPGRRTPLWLQRRRSADLLAVAAHYPDFPILLETYRECLRDVFDLRGLKTILRDIQQRVIRVRMERTGIASPFASSLMFNYAANFLYEGDAPLAERRAQTLALDHAQLRELLGDAELRELLDPGAVDELALELQRLDQRYQVKHPDALHELLQHLGDLTRDELAARCVAGAASDGRLDDWIEGLVQARRVIRIRIAGQRRLAAAEDAARFRDALGVAPPPGLPDAFLESVADPLGDLVSRYARTHVPFRAEQVAERFGLGIAPVREALQRLLARNRLYEGEFLPGSHGREWCDAEVLRLLKRRSLAKLRKQIEPVEPAALARFLIQWQGISVNRRSLDGLLDAVQQLQGLPLPASVWERDVLPSRIQDYRPSDLDELCAAGEIVWRGFDSLGSGDGRIALYLTDHLARLAPAATPVEGELTERVRQLFSQRGALFFDEILRDIGGFPNDLLDAIWQMIWAGELTNDTLAPLRSMLRSSGAGGRRNPRTAGGERSGRGASLACPARKAGFPGCGLPSPVSRA
jgi:ATP-dependent helicase Lhr and Lhr-like helicase